MDQKELQSLSETELVLRELGIPLTKLEDDVILSTYKDSNGNDIESLRLNVEVKGHPILFQFPTYGQWNSYTKDVGKLYTILAAYAETLEVANILNLPEDKYSLWAALSSSVIRVKKTSKLIERIFFKYLKPEIYPYTKFYNRFLAARWARNNIGIDFVFKMFVAILCVEDWIKKKSELILEKIYQQVTSRPSSQISTKNMESTRPPLTTSLSSESSVSF